MKYKVISFDLQGTLSDSSFSDEFWMELLPKWFSEKNGISITKAKSRLKKEFAEYGQYDYRYYSVQYWLDRLGLDYRFEEIRKQLIHPPTFFKDTLPLIKKLHGNAKLIMTSATTRDFINAELGEYKTHFDDVYSAIDDFITAGKPKEFYKKLSELLNVPPNEILHIGDSFEMDIENAKAAGFETFYFNKKQDRDKTLAKLHYLLDN